MSHNGITSQSVPWSYLRALEVEGRYPADTGAWAVTSQRLQFGEGLPNPTSKHFAVSLPESCEFPSAVPTLPPTARDPSEWLTYIRIDSLRELLTVLPDVRRPGVVVSLPLSPGWIAPPRGLIDLPQPNELLYDNTHMVALLGVVQPSGRLAFANSWGEEWGDAGYGYIPFKYFEDYVFEAFLMERSSAVKPESLRVQKVAPASRSEHLTLRRIVTRTAGNDRYYSFTIEDRPSDRLAWAFIRERGGNLWLEEFFVRPEFRRRGLSKILIQVIKELRTIKHLPLRILVSWAESRQMNPRGFDLMCQLVHQLGCTFCENSDTRSAYMATEGDSGADIPNEPSPYPTLPRGPLQDLVVASALLIAGSEATPPNGLHPLSVAVRPALLDESTIRSALDTINLERWRLVDKEADGTISAAELNRLEELQAKVRVLADHIAPTDTAHLERMKDLILRHGGEP